MADAKEGSQGPPSSKSLLIVVPNSLKVGGGQEQNILQLAVELDKGPFRVRVADFDTCFREEPRFTDAEIAARLGRVPRTTVGALIGVRRLTSLPTPRGTRRLRDLMVSSDLVLACPYYGEDAVIAVLAKLADRPLVASQNNTFLHRVRGNPREALQDLWNRTVGVRILRSIAGVRAVSQDEQRTLGSFGVERSVVLYPSVRLGATTEPVSVTEPPVPAGTAEGTGGPPELRVLVAGRMTVQKGISTLAEVLRTLALRPDRFSRFRFSFVGTRRLPAEIDRYVREVPDRVVNLGFVPKGISDVILRTDVMLMPSLYESFGATAVEAIRYGVPVVASDVSGLREIVRPGETGWLAPPRDPGAFVRALDRCLELKTTDPASWAKFRQGCRESYIRRFGPTASEAQYASFVGWLWNRAAGSSN